MLDLAIIGAGTAGLTAAIYGARAGLDCEVFDSGAPGGTTLTAAKIENWPGFMEITGPELMERFIEHASHYATINSGFHVETIEPIDGGFRLISSGREVEARATIIATGTDHRKLGVPGESEFAGRGVSYCATCDGFFFRGKRVLLVGGGNTAILDAIYLKDAGVDVTVVHRRDTLRAEESLQRELQEKGIPVLWNSVIREIRGEEMVTGVVLDTKGEISEMAVNGVFVAVGLVPRNKLARQLDLELDRHGYLVVTREMRTSMPFVYGAGDIVGGLQQIVTSCGEGAIAATSAYKDLRKPYWAQDAPE